jgi:hypothetical protein
MMRIALTALLVTASIGLPASAPEIKSTTRISIAAAHFAAPVEVTDQFVLTQSHVFAGRFIGDMLDKAPDSSWTRYTVTFDIQTLQGVKEAAYVVQYCADPATGEGFIYLPGRSEPAYRRNVSTILRVGQDGHWHRASNAWSAAINSYLRR